MGYGSLIFPIHVFSEVKSKETYSRHIFKLQSINVSLGVLLLWYSAAIYYLLMTCIFILMEIKFSTSSAILRKSGSLLCTPHIFVYKCISTCFCAVSLLNTNFTNQIRKFEKYNWAQKWSERGGANSLVLSCSRNSHY